MTVTIKVVRDYARRGHTGATGTIKPWVAFVDKRQLVDKCGRPQRFATEIAARAAAKRSEQ